MSELPNQIVVYKPNDVMRLEVRLENETVWLNRQQMAVLFGRDVKTIGKHIANALKAATVEKLIARAKSTILLIDSWVGVGTLDMLAKKRKGVVVMLVTSPRGNKLAQSDIAKFAAQYGVLDVKTSTAFHDRFLILDE